jgi:hypothetical protein
MAVPARATRRTAPMPPTVRKTVVVLHVIMSVGWLGVTFADVTLVATAIVSDTTVVREAMFRALGVIADVLLIPISWGSFLTGLLVSLGTKWGLVRHKWVLTKFCLTTVALALTTFSLVPGLKELRDQVVATPAGQAYPLHSRDVVSLLVAGVVSTSIYTTCVILSTFKPWGRTRWGKTTVAGKR